MMNGAVIPSNKTQAKYNSRKRQAISIFLKGQAICSSHPTPRIRRTLTGKGQVNIAALHSSGRLSQ